MMNDVVYWMTIAAFISGSLVAVLPFTKTASILSSALVGSFIFIIPIDHYIGSSLKYILVNFVRRAYVDGFNLAVLNFPFQVKFFFLFIYAGFLRLLNSHHWHKLKMGWPPTFRHLNYFDIKRVSFEFGNAIS